MNDKCVTCSRELTGLKNSYDYGETWYCSECGQAKECQDGLDDTGVFAPCVYTEAQMTRLITQATKVFQDVHGVKNAYHILMRIAKNI
jgi:hypothetical protein